MVTSQALKKEREIMTVAMIWEADMMEVEDEKGGKVN